LDKVLIFAMRGVFILINVLTFLRRVAIVAAALKTPNRNVLAFSFLTSDNGAFELSFLKKFNHKKIARHHSSFFFGMAMAIVFFLGLIGASAGQASQPRRYEIDTASRSIREIGQSTFSSLKAIAQQRKLVMLTFDDGPRDRVIDQEILDILKQHSAPSMWFVNCRNLDPALNAGYAENRATLRNVLRAGNLIANHSYNHLDLHILATSNPEKMRSEIVDCSTYLENVTGRRPEYFRAPWGDTTPAVVKVANEQGMKVTNWTSTTLDTMTDTPASILAAHTKFINEMAPEDGAIILMHDTKFTATHLDQLLSRLDRAGYAYAVPSEH
jgi:peptidoglycan/xylan/chitin deacetylase (PgdA/CDA1 family)